MERPTFGKKQEEPAPRPLLARPAYWLPIAAIVLAIIVLAAYDFNLTWIADHDAYKGAHATQLSDAEFGALKERKATELMGKMSTAEPDRPLPKLPSVWRECEKRTWLERMSKVDMETFYRTGHMPPLDEDIMRKKCFVKISEKTPNLFGPVSPVEQLSSDERYLMLQQLQRNCLNGVARQLGDMNVHIRNFCGCYATKQLASMQDDDVLTFRKTKQVPKNEQLHHQLTEQCAQ